MASLKYIGNLERMTVTLGSGYTAGSGTMVLTSGDGALLPDSGDFWLVTTDGVYRAFKVTARATDTLTVVADQDGTVDGNLSSGQQLEWNLTASALTQLKEDIATSPGTFLKSMPWEVEQTVALTTGIDSSITSVDFPLFPVEPATPYWVWIGLEQMKVTNVVGTVHTVVRGDGKTTAAAASAGATVTEAKWFKVTLGPANTGRQVPSRTPQSQINLVGAGESGNDILIGMVTKLPAAPWTLTMELWPFIMYWQNYNAMGLIMWEASSGKAVYWNCPYHVNGLQIIQMQSHDNGSGFGAPLASVGTFSALINFYVQQNGPVGKSPWLLRLQDNGTNWITSFSLDGVVFYTLQTAPRNQTITPDYIGMHVQARGGGNVGIQCSGYTLTAP